MIKVLQIIFEQEVFDLLKIWCRMELMIVVSYHCLTLHLETTIVCYIRVREHIWWWDHV